MIGVLLAFVLMAAFLFQAGAAVLSYAPTFDEPFHLANALTYLKTGHVPLDLDVHLPLMRLLMSSFLRLKVDIGLFQAPASYDAMYEAGYRFLFQSGLKPESLLTLIRLPSVILGLFAAMLVFLWSRRWHGVLGGLLSLTLFVFDPNLVAHASLATTDMGLLFFLLMSVYFYFRWLEERKRMWLVLTGVSTGLALLTKAPAFILFPWIFVLGFMLRPDEGPKTRLKSIFLDEATVICVSGIVALAVVGFHYFPGFLKNIGSTFSILVEAKKTAAVTANFFHGPLPSEKTWLYMLGVFLIKTPLPLLVLWVVAVVLFRSDRRMRALLMLVGTYGLCCSIARYQRGVRYLLPIYPFLCIAAGRLATLPGIRWRSAVWGTAALAVAGAAWIYPHPLAYFTPLVGASQGYNWLVDSNLDWGQDLGEVGRYLRKQGNPEVVLASFGTASPDYYIGPRQDLLIGSLVTWPESFKHINSENPSRELLVVSATYLQGFFTYTFVRPAMFDWLREKEPLTVIGYSQFVYDITTDAESHFRLGLIYSMHNQPAFARREFNRAVSLDPENAFYRQAFANFSTVGKPPVLR